MPRIGRPRNPPCPYTPAILRRQRISEALTQAALAALLGVRVGQVAKWEQGRMRPSLRVRPLLERALGLEPAK